MPPPSRDDVAARLSVVLPVYAPMTLKVWMDFPSMLGPLSVDFDEGRLLAMLAQVAKGVAFLHSRELVHGALDATTVLVEDRR